MSRLWQWGVWAYAIAAAALLLLPVIAGAARTPDGSFYMGGLSVPTGFHIDYYSHAAKLWHGARGDWAYRLLFTTEPHPPLIGVQAFYIALGTLSRNPPYDFPLIYHAARAVLNVALIVTLARFIERYFARPAERWTALIFATLMTGWGWLLYGLAPALLDPDPPIEFWLMDAYHLTGGLYMPHFSAAALLQLATVMLLDDWRRMGGAGRLTALTGVMAASALVQPYGLLLMLPLCGLYALITLVILPRQNGQPVQRRILWLAIPFGAQALIAIAQYVALTSDPVWRNFTAQNITLSPTPLHYLFGYGPFLLPILIAAFVAVRRRLWRGLTAENAHWLLPMLWVGLVALLVYAPFPTQRRYLLGVQSALAVLAAWGWQRLIAPVFGVRARLAAVGYVGSAMIALMMLLFLNTAGLTPALQPEAYVSAGEQEAAAWIRANSDDETRILTIMNGKGQGSGGRVVFLTGRTVYLGHWIETADFASKAREAISFYAPWQTDSGRQALLENARIALIWYDRWAIQIDAWSPNDADFLTPVFRNPTVTLYAPR